MRTKSLQTFALIVAAGWVGCSPAPPSIGDGDGSGNSGGGAVGGSTSGGAGGSTATGGTQQSGGTTSTGGSLPTGGTPSSGGTDATGGSVSGSSGASGSATGGLGGSSTGGLGGTTTGGSAGAMGGSATGGSAGIGGQGGSGGMGGGGGKAGSGATGGSGGASTACSTTMLPSGGTTRMSSNAQGTAAGLAWTIWSNGSGGSITTYGTPAFRATWNNSGDFLARLGLQWNATRTYDTYGIITADYSSSKTGTAGGYSYIGIYGWSVSPCVEFYIVDDSYNRMPVNPGSTTSKGTASIDGGTYNLYTRNTTGTGGSKCPGVNSWVQFYSIRTMARTCGRISVTEHFDAWAAQGMVLGRMDQAQIFVEAGGGVGSIDFPLATMTATMP